MTAIPLLSLRIPYERAAVCTDGPLGSKSRMQTVVQHRHIKGQPKDISGLQRTGEGH